MKVALTVWNGWISPVFDVCREAQILDIDNGKIISTAKTDLHPASPVQKIDRLVALGVKTLICGAISEPVYAEAAPRNLIVIGFIAGPVEEVVQAFLANRLPNPSLCMPGCRNRQRRFRGGRGQRRGRGRGQGRGRGGQGRNRNRTNN